MKVKVKEYMTSLFLLGARGERSPAYVETLIMTPRKRILPTQNTSGVGSYKYTGAVPFK